MRMGIQIDDPHPECQHAWLGIGATTICDPPISHSVCFSCRTFRHQAHGYMPGEVGEPPWYTDDVKHMGIIWDWEEEKAKLS